MTADYIKKVLDEDSKVRSALQSGRDWALEQSGVSRLQNDLINQALVASDVEREISTLQSFDQLVSPKGITNQFESETINQILKDIKHKQDLISKLTKPALSQFGSPTIAPRSLDDIREPDTIESLESELEIEKSLVCKLDKANDGLRESFSALELERHLDYLITRISVNSHKSLKMKKSDLLAEFESANPKQAFVISIDIRRSTDLMLNAVSASVFSEFLMGLSNGLAKIIKENFGVFDKFTGDGALAFFPKFYSGKHAAFHVMKAAEQAHSFFECLYREKSDSFKIVLKDVGFGIGIDYGDISLLKMPDGLTAVGEPVVYACRFSGAPAGKTYINEQAVKQFKALDLEAEITKGELIIKNAGAVQVSEIKILDETFVPDLPDWFPKSAAS